MRITAVPATTTSTPMPISHSAGTRSCRSSSDRSGGATSGRCVRTEAFALGASWWDLSERRAAATPDHVLLDDDRDRSLSCEAFKARAETTAAGLASLGVRADHIVSWQLPTTLEAAVLMAALSRLGVAQNPIIPILRPGQGGFVVDPG